MSVSMMKGKSRRPSGRKGLEDFERETIRSRGLGLQRELEGFAFLKTRTAGMFPLGGIIFQNGQRRMRN